MKYLLLLFILLYTPFVQSQNNSFQEDINEAFNLFNQNRIQKAQAKVDSLKLVVKSNPKIFTDKQQTLTLTYIDALILDKLEIESYIVLDKILGLNEEAEKLNLHDLSYKFDLLIALSFEKSHNYELTDEYLNSALAKSKKYHLDSIYSTYCIRRSSYFRFVDQLDSSYIYALEGRKYAEKFNNTKDFIDSHILLSYYAHKTKNYNEALKHQYILIDYSKKQYDTLYSAVMYNSMANVLLKLNKFQEALLYNDSAYSSFYSTQADRYGYIFPKTRSAIYDSLHQFDSAYFYLKTYTEKWSQEIEKDDKLKTQELEEKYNQSKYLESLRLKNQQIIFIFTLFIIITAAIILLFIQFKKIKRNNQIINSQLHEISRSLKQKKVLLSELQHRVKNNLQHVISILEIQKESVDFNNIDELIRATQNRVHSMALLHKKLKVSDQVNHVELEKYISELSELVKESYDTNRVKVQLKINCEIETLTLEKASPLGLILVELVSNSMKHAFNNNSIGIIQIDIRKHENGFVLYYSDNGGGFDFNEVSKKGIGQEIIKGLIDQLNGYYETKFERGFELTVYFK